MTRRIEIASEPLAGSLWSTVSPCAEEGFVFRDTVSKLWYNGQVYLLPDNPPLHLMVNKIIVANYVYLLVRVSDGIKLNTYEFNGDSLTLIASTLTGNSETPYTDAICLNDGRVVISYYQQERSTDTGDLEVFFTDGSVTTSVTLTESQLWSNKGVLCQHPVSEDVWYFHVCDSEGVMMAVRLSSDLSPISTNSLWIPRDGSLLQPSSEIPCLKMIPTEDKMLLAYQNNTFEIFTGSPFVKGAHISVLEIDSEGNKVLRGVMERWVERVSRFCLGYQDGMFWLAYPRIDEAALDWKSLWYYREDGTETYLGQMKDGVSGLARTMLTNNSTYIIADMEDLKIHSFMVQSEKIKEWDAKCKAESLHKRPYDKLQPMHDSQVKKGLAVRKDLSRITRFPDAEKASIYDQLVESGEIEALPDDGSLMPLAVQSIIDAEWQSQVDFYATKIARLETVSELVAKEKDMRDKGQVTRVVGEEVVAHGS